MGPYIIGPISTTYKNVDQQVLLIGPPVFYFLLWRVEEDFCSMEDTAASGGYTSVDTALRDWRASDAAGGI